MFPSEAITSSSLDALLFYCSLLGILLFIGVILRLKVNIFKKLFIPASLIAGVIGLILGEYGIGLLPTEITQSWGALPGRLITVVFAPMLIGMELPNIKKVGKTIVPHLYFGFIADFLQIALPFIVSALVLEPVWGVNKMFGSIVEVGWAGGHGTAGGMSDVYQSLNWADGGDLGLTSATVGLFVGIIVGIIIINYGVRKGYTSIIKSSSELNINAENDIIDPSEREANSIATINNDVVESYAFHSSLIAIAIFIGWIFQGLVKKYTGLEMPLFPMAMIGGFFVQLAIGKTKFAQAIDVNTLQRIQGIALDFLIVSAIASIKIPVIINYALPFLILMLVAGISLVAFFFWAGPKLFKENWFENSIINFGFLSGVAAVGLMLLRTVDPDMETDVGQAFALRTPIFEPFLGGGLITSILPILAVKYGSLKTGLAFLVIALVLIVLAKFTGYWCVSEKDVTSHSYSMKTMAHS
ncbi:MAG TPA: sodium:glutamate symporter [Thermoanaerobacterales bacterium]|jgi:ESS family glutamate:Na+ symporter|nr:sodium:glutamate symporter [Thermoanaerobacterales bacterium]